jgi:hypothetical protein
MTNAVQEVFKREEWGTGYAYETLNDYFRCKDHQKSWLIKGIIAEGETSAWVGPPGSLKSALMADMAIAIAANRNWHGKRTKARNKHYDAGVVYFALERADLVKRRIEAQINRLGLAEADLSDITVVPCMLDLAHEDSVAKLVRTVKNIEAFTGMVAGVLVFDTFAKLIAAGGGDEDKAKDQGRVLANIARVKENLGGPHVALVGHTGKDETRGARGSNAILGDVDVMVVITGDEVKTATVTKANDMPEGPLFSFKGELYEFGKDEDGDPITVNIISAETIDPDAVKVPTNRRLSPRQQLAIEALSEAVLSAGQPVPAEFDLPSTVSAVTANQWRDELYRRGVLSPQDKNPRAEFKRLGEALAARQRIGRRDGLVWLA